MRLVALVVAIVLFIIVTLSGFEVVTIQHPWGWLGAGLTAFAISFLPLPEYTRR